MSIVSLHTASFHIFPKSAINFNTNLDKIVQFFEGKTIHFRVVVIFEISSNLWLYGINSPYFNVVIFEWNFWLVLPPWMIFGALWSDLSYNLYVSCFSISAVPISIDTRILSIIYFFSIPYIGLNIPWTISLLNSSNIAWSSTPE